jgi:hypothetical protein
MSSNRKETDSSTNDGDGDTSLSSSLNGNNICRRISMSGTIETSSAGIKLYEASQQQDLQQQQQQHQPFEGIEQFLLYDEDDDEYDGDESGTSNTMAESSDQSVAIQRDSESSSRNTAPATSQGPTSSKKDKPKTSSNTSERGSKKEELPHASLSILKHLGTSTHSSPTTTVSRGVALPMVQPGRKLSIPSKRGSEAFKNNSNASSIAESLSTTKRSINTSDLESSGSPNIIQTTTTTTTTTKTRDRIGGEAHANKAGGPWGSFFKRRRYTTLSNQIPPTDSVVYDEDNDNDDDNDSDDDDDDSSRTLNYHISRWFYKNEMTVLIVVAIALAWAYPPLGAKYLYPHITTTWILLPFILCT